jgi:hypothetical protein
MVEAHEGIDMPIEKEWTCAGHGPFENASGKCPVCKNKLLVTREIRTAPAFRRSGNMRWVDRQLKEIAAENGLTDMRNDGKAGLSVMDMELRKRQLAAAKAADASPNDPRKVGGWVKVPHAPAGFSRTGAQAPTVSGATFGTPHSFGFQPGPGTVPQPKPMIVAKSGLVT